MLSLGDNDTFEHVICHPQQQPSYVSPDVTCAASCTTCTPFKVSPLSCNKRYTRKNKQKHVLRRVIEKLKGNQMYTCQPIMYTHISGLGQYNQYIVVDRIQHGLSDCSAANRPHTQQAVMHWMSLYIHYIYLTIPYIFNHSMADSQTCYMFRPGLLNSYALLVIRWHQKR